MNPKQLQRVLSTDFLGVILYKSEVKLWICTKM